MTWQSGYRAGGLEPGGLDRSSAPPPCSLVARGRQTPALCLGYWCVAAAHALFAYCVFLLKTKLNQCTCPIAKLKVFLSEKQMPIYLWLLSAVLPFVGDILGDQSSLPGLCWHRPSCAPPPSPTPSPPLSAEATLTARPFLEHSGRASASGLCPACSWCLGCFSPPQVCGRTHLPESLLSVIFLPKTYRGHFVFPVLWHGSCSVVLVSAHWLCSLFTGCPVPLVRKLNEGKDLHLFCSLVYLKYLKCKCTAYSEQLNTKSVEVSHPLNGIAYRKAPGRFFLPGKPSGNPFSPSVLMEHL